MKWSGLVSRKTAGGRVDSEVRSHLFQNQNLETIDFEK